MNAVASHGAQFWAHTTCQLAFHAAAAAHSIVKLVLLRLTEVAAASHGQQQALLPHQHSGTCHQVLLLALQRGCVGTHEDMAAAHPDQ